MFRRSAIPSAEVHATLGKHILVDGYPFVVDLEKSRGSLVHDALTGNELVDFYSFFASNPLGFNHPGMLDERTRERLARVSTVKVANSDKYTTYYAEFVDTVERTCGPKDLTKYFFVEGGALAVENALKTAFDWKVRKNIAAGHGDQKGMQVLHLKHAFHGRSGYTLSLTNTDPNKTNYFPKFDWPRIPSPMIRWPLAQHLAETEERERATLAAAEAAFAERPNEIAAIIIEPIQAEGGDNHFRPELFAALRRLADEHEALLVFDEVQTGVGATGKWWAYEHYGVTPDIICFAKKLQVGGIFVGDRIDDMENVFTKPGRINSTWGGGLVDMVRATRILEIIVDEDLLANAKARGDELLAGLKKIQERHPMVDNARGLGLLCAFDLPDGAKRDAAIKRCFADGMLVLSCGSRTVRFRPSLNVTAEIVAEGLKRLEKAITEAEAL